ncbi:unnamed protein product [Cuscuta campestris]|uniref:Uncharacterized protein n=1 Tax=Cuscuta campestris TaxID=132261 RepID=A0A484MQN9_9ASTE|nr:unnamed protein product [Cuscuta campestris]
MSWLLVVIPRKVGKLAFSLIAQILVFYVFFRVVAIDRVRSMFPGKFQLTERVFLEPIVMAMEKQKPKYL